MKDINEVKLVGNLGQDPELRSTASGISVANGSMATTKKFKKDGQWQENTTWHSLVAWREVAEKFAQLSKGARVFVCGELTLREWDDRQSGAKRSKVEVLVTRICEVQEITESGPKSDSGGFPNAAPPSDDDIPF